MKSPATATKLVAEQRQALRNATSEIRTMFAHGQEIDPRFLRMIEQSARLKGLKFESAPPDDGREMQPVIDGDGRIAGFFTWQETEPVTAAMSALMPYIAALIVALLAFAAYSLWHLRRAARDVSESEALARRAADQDKLTGMPNHAKMVELLDLALSEREPGETTTFVIFELDGMAHVAANFGVLGSDELIVAVADRIREAAPPGAMCGRIGSDEFALLLTSDDGADVDAMVAAMLQSLARPHWFETVVRVSAHAGFAQAPAHHAATRGELTRRAELALRAAAKKGPGSRVAFDAQLDAVSADQKFIQRELPRAVSAHELELHYQPIISAHGGRIVGVEALLRWTHAQRGPIGPAVFIPIAEQMGLMDTIGAFVLRRALQETRRWPDLYVAVNLSPLQVRDGSIVEVVRSALEDSGVPPSRLMLEITEGVLVDNPDEMVLLESRIGTRSVCASRSTISARAIRTSATCSVFRSTSSRSTAASSPRWAPPPMAASSSRPSSRSAARSACRSWSRASRPNSSARRCGLPAATRCKASCSPSRRPPRRSTGCSSCRSRVAARRYRKQ